MSKSRSVGEMYCVPESHWTLEIVGRGGSSRVRLIMVSRVFSRERPVPPQTGRTAISEGPVKPRTSPVLEMTVDTVRRGSSMGSGRLAISRRPGSV